MIFLISVKFIFPILFMVVGLAIQVGWGLSVIGKMKRHVEKTIAQYPDEETKFLENHKIYFKNFDLWKKKKRYEFSGSIIEPIYSFSLCDLYIRKDVILLIGKKKFWGKTIQINITVFEHKSHSEGDSQTQLENIRLEKDYLDIEFKDRRFDKPITAKIKIGKGEDLESDLIGW